MSSEFFNKKFLPPELKYNNAGQDRNNQNSLVGKQLDGGPLMLNNFLMSDNNNDSIEGKQLQKNNSRDIYFLMDRYKKENNGIPTTDICLLFSYWQTNFGHAEMLLNSHKNTFTDEKTTFNNYNSKSFNNQTYFNNDRQQQREISLEGSPIQPGPKYDVFQHDEQNSLENNAIGKDKELVDSLEFEYNSLAQN